MPRTRPGIANSTNVVAENELLRISIGGYEHTLDPRGCQLYVREESLYNPFASGEFVGWCRCDSQLKPHKFRIDQTETGVVIRCMDCGNFIAVTQEQKLILLTMLCVRNDNKIRLFQRWRRRLSDVLARHRRHGNMDSFAHVMQEGLDDFGRPYPRRRNPSRRRTTRHSSARGATLNVGEGTAGTIHTTPPVFVDAPNPFIGHGEAVRANNSADSLREALRPPSRSAQVDSEYIQNLNEMSGTRQRESNEEREW